MIKKLLLLFSIIISSDSFSQDAESWNTINISGNLTPNTYIVAEGEQRYNVTENYVRYFHYDIGYVVKVSKKSKIGFYYRDIYEMKKNYRIHEARPHIDYFYETGPWKLRTRLEYQFKEIYQDGWRARFRPLYQTHVFNNFNPYVSTEINVTEKGITRSRSNLGVTIKYDKFEIQPGYILEANGLYTIPDFRSLQTLTYRNSIWINFKIKL